MMNAEILFPSEYMCPILEAPMLEPILTLDGSSFEKVAIEQWFSRGQWRNPSTFARLSNRSIVPNLVMKKIITQFLKNEGQFQREKTTEEINLQIDKIEKIYQNFLANKSIQERMSLFREDMHMFNSELNLKKNTFGPIILMKDGNYEGQCKDGLPHGLGIYSYANGQIFEGNFMAGERQGIGRLINVKGEVVEAEFKKGEQVGRGILYLTDEDRYEGQLKHFKRDGKGIIFRKNQIEKQSVWQDGEESINEP